MLNFNKNGVVFIAIVAIFLAIRLFGIGHIYHQDEYRWATIVNPEFNLFNESPHPPLTKYFLFAAGHVFGFDYLRIIPLLFSFLNLILIYLVVRKLTGKSEAGLIGAGLFAINIYSAIASLQIDIDGALLPFFILLGYHSYLYLIEDLKSKRHWFLFSLSLAGGFLTKLSYLLFPATLIIYFIWIDLAKGGKSINLKKFLYFLIPTLFLAGAFYLLYAVKFGFIIKYAQSFNVLNFQLRKYFDLVFKIFKSLVWLSPLLFWPLLAGLFNKAVIKKYGFWYLYILINLLFYGVAFDFTTKTIERYFMFLIAPTIIIISSILYNIFALFLKFKWTHLAAALLLFLKW